MSRIRHPNISERYRRGKVGFSTPLLSRDPKMRPCPKCGAASGQLCRRVRDGRVVGEGVEGGYTKPLKKVHAERQAHRERVS